MSDNQVPPSDSTQPQGQGQTPPQPTQPYQPPVQHAQPGQVSGGPDTPPPPAGGQHPVPPAQPAQPAQPGVQAQPAQPGFQGQPGQPGVQPQAPAPGYPAAPPPAVPTTNQNAIIALVLAIASWVLCPLVLAIIALFLASNADKEIKASNGWSTGSGLVTATKVLAWLNIVVSLLAILFGIVMIVIAVNSPEFQYEINNPSNWATPTSFDG